MALNFNFGPFTASNFGLEPIDLSKVSAPLSNADLFASASRAASSPVLQGNYLRWTTLSKWTSIATPSTKSFAILNLTQPSHL
jgi:hypothetical protein